MPENSRTEMRPSRGYTLVVSWYDSAATTFSKILNGPRSALVGLLSATFIYSETWKAIVIKTGALGLVTKPVCTVLSMEAWFTANVIGRETASVQVRYFIMTCI